MSTGIVLASLRGSTYRSVRLTSSLAAALPDGHFKHPAKQLCGSVNLNLDSSLARQGHSTD